MPNAWSAKDERKYKHIKDSAQERGKSEQRAKEVAARTVNKARREDGRSENKQTQGTGNPNSSLDARSRQELLNRAKQLGINGRTRMSKSELIESIRAH